LRRIGEEKRGRGRETRERRERKILAIFLERERK
jgi:hypothetical protein